MAFRGMATDQTMHAPAKAASPIPVELAATPAASTPARPPGPLPGGRRSHRTPSAKRPAAAIWRIAWAPIPWRTES